MEYPLLLDRIKSTTIDTLILIACMLLFTEILGLFENIPNWVRMVLFASLLMYEPICIAFGATIGNDKIKIRVRRNSDPTKRLNLFQSIIRFFFKIVFGWLSFVTIFFLKEKEQFMI